MTYVLQALVAILAAISAFGFLAAIENPFVAVTIASPIVLLAAYVIIGIKRDMDETQ